MDLPRATMFDLAAWNSALGTFGAVTQLSVALFDAEARQVGGPLPATPLHTVFQEGQYDPGLFAECTRRCLSQSGTDRPAVIVAPPSGLAVVGTSLSLDGKVVGAAVAGYAIVEFCNSGSMARLAREANLPFPVLWDVVRRQQPIPTRRLVLHGELLQVLGDTLLRETARTRQYRETSAALADGLAAKDQFLAVLSHELRSPLTPILGWTQVLQGDATDVQVKRAGEVIERNALLQLRLVEDLLELNRSFRGNTVLHLTDENLGDALREAIDAIQEQAQAQAKVIALRFIDASEPIAIRADRHRLQQIVRNLLLNAVKFTPRGGRIDIRLERAGDEAIVRVTDDGEGIAAEFLPFVFDMFRQQNVGTRRKHGGMGIGLALVKSLIEAHGGWVRVTSGGPGAGTEVTFSLPILMKPADALPRLTDSTTRLDGLRTLVVEDQGDASDVLRLALNAAGAEVLIAHDGVDGLATLALEPVDVVLCDLEMPRLDGFEFLAELVRLRGSDRPPVIAVSALASSADHARTSAAGFEAHLDKPFSTAALIDLVGRVAAGQTRP